MYSGNEMKLELATVHSAATVSIFSISDVADITPKYLFNRFCVFKDSFFSIVLTAEHKLDHAGFC
jgi:hypothetical protein